MTKIKWDMWKVSFPLKCSECGHKHGQYRRYCEKCGKERVLIKTTKEDYKAWKKGKES